MFKIKNVAKLLLGSGAIMVSLHTVTIMFGACAEKTQCMANVYFGIPQNTNIPIMSDLTQVSNSSAAFVLGNTAFSITDVFTVLQVTGLYLILLGIVALIIFQLNKLSFLKPSRLAHK